MYDIIRDYLYKKYYGDKPVPLASSGDDIFSRDVWIKENYPLLYKIKNTVFSIECWFSRMSL